MEGQMEAKPMHTPKYHPDDIQRVTIDCGCWKNEHGHDWKGVKLAGEKGRPVTVFMTVAGKEFGFVVGAESTEAEQVLLAALCGALESAYDEGVDPYCLNRL